MSGKEQEYSCVAKFKRMCLGNVGVVGCCALACVSGGVYIVVSMCICSDICLVAFSVYEYHAMYI